MTRDDMRGAEYYRNLSSFDILDAILAVVTISSKGMETDMASTSLQGEKWRRGGGGK